MVAIEYSIYSQSVHALALNAGSMNNDAGRYCISAFSKIGLIDQSSMTVHTNLSTKKLQVA